MSVWPTRSGARHGSMVSYLSSALRSGRPRSPSTWSRRGAHHRRAGERSFNNHAEGVAALDLFVVPTLSFRLLFGLLMLRHDRRNSVVGRDRTSNGGMDCAEGHGSVPLGQATKVSAT